MRIMVIGSGKIGYALTERLVEEGHELTVIDSNEEALRRVRELDVLTLKGNGASLALLEQARVERTDVVIAATANDEINMLCCLTAKKLGAEYTVARIRNPEYTREIRQLKQQLDINLVINPEQSTAAEILRLLRFPSANLVETFTRGRVELIGFRVERNDIIVGIRLEQLRKKIPVPVLICVVERGDQVIIPSGSFVIEASDRIYIMGGPPEITRFLKALGRVTNMVRNVMMVGGGRIAYYLARDASEIGVKPTIIEIDPRVCAILAEQLSDTTVIQGNGTEQDLLEGANLKTVDAFVALTGRDEDNLMISLFAMHSGVPKAIVKVNRQNYSVLAKKLGIDTLIAPKDITANHILHFVRGLENSQGRAMETLYRLIDGRVEAMEFTVRRDTRYLGVPLKDLRLKRNLLVGIISRRGHSIIPAGNDRLNEGDSVIIVTTHSGFTNLNDIFED